jgi:enoyl-CoA hydratase
MEKENMIFENIQVYKDGAIGLIKISRPEVRNALNAETIEEIGQALEQWERHNGIKVIVITGEGNKSFISGADINQLNKKSMFEGLNANLSTLCKRIEDSPKATIAAINGYALGGGCELALACDIRIASENALIGMPELNLAIIPGGGGTQRLSRIVGKGRAMDLILSGELINAEQAERIGLVSTVVPQEELWETVLNKAVKIMGKGPLSVRLAKLVINAGMDTDMNTALALEKLAQSILLGSEDKQEGTNAFLEKRKPVFRGK